MSQILNKVRNVDPNNSDAIKESLTPFFQNLSKHTEAESGRWLRALENVINRFPKYCMSQRATVETYLTHFLDSSNYYIVIEAAKCAHALQQVRPSHEKTATAKSCWRDMTSALCETAHDLIGSLFPHAVDIYQQTGKLQAEQHTNGSPLLTALSQLSSVTSKTQNNKALNKQTLFCTRLRNVFVFLQVMLVEIYPVAKPIRPQMILDVIVRALSVSSGTNSLSQSLDDVVTVKTQALRTLDALVACLGSNLLPFSPLVFRFVMQTLKWSSDNPSDQSRKVRCSAYNSLVRWLEVLHVHRLAADRGKCWEDELTQHIIDDITPPRHVVELKMSNQPTKHLSKKAKRKMANSMLQESSIASHMPGEKNKVVLSKESDDEVAIAALECAETFLTVCGIFLKPATHKRLQERLVRSCYSLHECSESRALAAVRALDACRAGCSPALPPPTQHCLQIYCSLATSPRRELSNFCSRALLDIRLHLHCSPPSLNFAIEAPAPDTRTEEKRNISERNRAALEALLGAERMPIQKDDELITVAEEPLNKKPRLDDVDKISVSSESVKSMEINVDDEQDVEFVSENKSNEEISNAIDDRNVPDEIDGENEEKRLKDHDYAKEKNSILQTPITQIDDKDISENKVDSTQPDNGSIYDVATQIPVNISSINNDDDDETPLSMEVAYDYPSTGTEKLTILEKLDAENIPSSNETDDIQITCGQIVKSSQDNEIDKKSEIEAKSAENVIKNTEVKVNGLEKPLQNGNVTEADTSKDVTVEDMLADFVDEVNDDTQAAANSTQH